MAHEDVNNHIHIHNCKKEDEIRELQIKIAVAESDVKNVKDDIKDVKDDVKETKNTLKNVESKMDENNKTVHEKMDKGFNKILWWIISILFTVTSGMSLMIYNYLTNLADK